MTTQYTSILKLALPVQGELSGTWGDVVNDNITSMVEEAIAGRAVIDSWTTNSHTLTSANGTTSESRCAMLEFTDTGTALSGDATVICPTAAKIYICKNDAGQKVTIKTSAGTGVAIADGQTMFVFCDGTNVVEAVTSMSSLKLGTAATSVQVTAVLDEDDLVSDSATALATQQSIKAYVDAQVTAQDLDFGGDSGTGSVDLDSQTFTIAGTANEIETSASGQTLTVGLPAAVTVTTAVTTPTVQVTDVKANDGTAAVSIANTTGQTTITDAVLTTADINAGTIDNTTIGATTASTGAFTTITSSGNTTVSGQLVTDTISEETATAGVTVDGVLLKDSQVNTDQINEKTATSGVTVDGVLLKDGGATFNSVITINSASYFVGNSTNGFRFNNDTDAQTLFYVKNTGEAVFNDNSIDYDFRVESDANANMLFVDAGENAVKIGGTTTREGALQVFTNAGGVAMEIESTNAGSGQGPILQLRRTSSSPAGNDYLGGLNFVGQDSGNNALSYVDMFTRATTITDGSEESQFSIRTRRNGVLEERFTLNAVETSFNEAGSDLDFRVESNSNTHALFVDASTDRVGIKTTSPGYPLTVSGVNASSSAIGIVNTTNSHDWYFGASTSPDALVLVDVGNTTTPMSFYYGAPTNSFIVNNGATVFNESSADQDFRVESDTNTHALFVDASYNAVGIGDSTPTVVAATQANTSLNVAGVISVHGILASHQSNALVLERNGDTSSIRAYGSTAGSGILTLKAAGGGASADAERIRIRQQDVIINEVGDDVDFRVESDTNANLIFADASANKVGIKDSSPDYDLSVSGTTESTAGFISQVFTQTTGTPFGAVAGGGPDSAKVMYVALPGEKQTTAINLGGGNTAGNNSTAWISSQYTGNFAADIRLWAPRQGNYTYGNTDATNVARFTESTTEFFSQVAGPSGAFRETLKLNTAGIVVNEDSHDLDFRIESNSQSNCFFMDAGNSQITLTSVGGYRARFEDNGDGQRIASTNVGHTMGMVSGISYALGSNNTFIKLTGGGGVVRITANSNGVNLNNNATSFSSASDIRLKNITGTFTNAIEDVKTLEPVKFTWKHDAENTPNVGFTAQSVQPVLPEAVDSNDVFDDGNEYLSVRYTEVIPLLTAALQEAIAKIETLEAKVAALENA